MSASQGIPIKRVTVHDSSELPQNCCATPGGTLFSTTPGGSRIVYERSTLMSLRNSPISKTPPKWDIPDEIRRGSNNGIRKNNWNSKFNNKNNNKKCNQGNFKAKIEDGEPLFQIDI